jgi:hypothetical protein
MNLVKSIDDLLPGGLLGSLSSALGTDPKTTGQATTAAVPTIMAGLASLGNSDDGVRRLSGVLGSLDTSGPAVAAPFQGGDTPSILSKGMGMLGSLFGEDMIGKVAAAISRFAGLDSGTVRKLIAFLTPTVLGKVASQWKREGGTPSALSNLLAEQKRYIPDSLPAGYSLDNIPGLTAAKDFARTAADSTRRVAGTAQRAAPSVLSWLLPLAGLLLLALLLWQFLGRRAQPAPELAQQPSPVQDMRMAVPGLTQLTDQVTSTFGSLGQTFTGIKDAASAEAAIPTLEGMKGKLDSITDAIKQLSGTGRASIHKIIGEKLIALKDQARTILSYPGISERVRTLINQIMIRLEDWHVISRTN